MSIITELLLFGELVGGDWLLGGDFMGGEMTSYHIKGSPLRKTFIVIIIVIIKNFTTLKEIS